MARRKTVSEQLMDYCRALTACTEDVKWENDLVFSVGGKMFAAFHIPEGRPLSLRVEPDLFTSLVEQPEFVPAPYLAKHDWVNVDEPEALPIEILEELLSDSHRLVSTKLSKKKQRALGLID